MAQTRLYRDEVINNLANRILDLIDQSLSAELSNAVADLYGELEEEYYFDDYKDSLVIRALLQACQIRTNQVF